MQAPADAFSSISASTLNRYQAMAPLGELKLSLLYNRKDSTLSLLLIKAERLAESVTETHRINIFCKVCILPDKTHRQMSKIVRGTHNPHFNQQIVFQDIKTCSLQEANLRLRVCNQVSSRKLDTLGEVTLPFRTLGLEHGEEVRIWRDIEPKSTNQVRYINYLIYMMRNEQVSPTFPIQAQSRKTYLGVRCLTYIFDLAEVENFGQYNRLHISHYARAYTSYKL